MNVFIKFDCNIVSCIFMFVYEYVMIIDRYIVNKILRFSKMGVVYKIGSSLYFGEVKLNNFYY